MRPEALLLTRSHEEVQRNPGWRFACHVSEPPHHKPLMLWRQRLQDFQGFLGWHPPVIGKLDALAPKIFACLCHEAAQGLPFLRAGAACGREPLACRPPALLIFDDEILQRLDRTPRTRRQAEK
eukprot:CAMPEP_0180659452 /NCGR_PEP_ID=MMETSP1037_2-20121125/57591_1 /TAXON_ID=632150 /ORGANISM="Azadinium spinosum, Strain 3D9" /LENGTH=123 /DNA_ID=CAMNT_0022686499 /DNA_START=120 /DNA_END=491 /DNA_ORIENTATION=+